MLRGEEQEEARRHACGKEGEWEHIVFPTIHSYYSDGYRRKDGRLYVFVTLPSSI